MTPEGHSRARQAALLVLGARCSLKTYSSNVGGEAFSEVRSTRGPERGYDGAKPLAGRKRHLLVDTNGLLVLTAGVHGADLCTTLTAGGNCWRRTRDLNCTGWNWFGLRVHTLQDSASTSSWNWVGGWRCPITANGSCGATAWGRSPAGSRSCPRGSGSWSARSLG